MRAHRRVAPRFAPRREGRRLRIVAPHHQNFTRRATTRTSPVVHELPIPLGIRTDYGGNRQLPAHPSPPLEGVDREGAGSRARSPPSLAWGQAPTGACGGHPRSWAAPSASWPTNDISPSPLDPVKRQRGARRARPPRLRRLQRPTERQRRGRPRGPARPPCRGCPARRRRRPTAAAPAFRTRQARRPTTARCPRSARSTRGWRGASRHRHRPPPLPRQPCDAAPLERGVQRRATATGRRRCRCSRATPPRSSVAWSVAPPPQAAAVAAAAVRRRPARAWRAASRHRHRPPPLPLQPYDAAPLERGVQRRATATGRSRCRCSRATPPRSSVAWSVAPPPQAAAVAAAAVRHRPRCRPPKPPLPLPSSAAVHSCSCPTLPLSAAAAAANASTAAAAVAVAPDGRRQPFHI